MGATSSLQFDTDMMYMQSQVNKMAYSNRMLSEFDNILNFAFSQVPTSFIHPRKYF